MDFDSEYICKVISNQTKFNKISTIKVSLFYLFMKRLTQKSGNVKNESQLSTIINHNYELFDSFEISIFCCNLIRCSLIFKF